MAFILSRKECMAVMLVNFVVCSTVAGQKPCHIEYDRVTLQAEVEAKRKEYRQSFLDIKECVDMTHKIRSFIDAMQSSSPPSIDVRFDPNSVMFDLDSAKDAVSAYRAETWLNKISSSLNMTAQGVVQHTIDFIDGRKGMDMLVLHSEAIGFLRDSLTLDAYPPRVDPSAMRLSGADDATRSNISASVARCASVLKEQRARALRAALQSYPTVHVVLPVGFGDDGPFYDQLGGKRSSLLQCFDRGAKTRDDCTVDDDMEWNAKNGNKNALCAYTVADVSRFACNVATPEVQLRQCGAASEDVQARNVGAAEAPPELGAAEAPPELGMQRMSELILGNDEFCAIVKGDIGSTAMHTNYNDGASRRREFVFVVVCILLSAPLVCALFMLERKRPGFSMTKTTGPYAQCKGTFTDQSTFLCVGSVLLLLHWVLILGAFYFRQVLHAQVVCFDGALWEQHVAYVFYQVLVRGVEVYFYSKMSGCGAGFCYALVKLLFGTMGGVDYYTDANFVAIAQACKPNPEVLFGHDLADCAFAVFVVGVVLFQVIFPLLVAVASPAQRVGLLMTLMNFELLNYYHNPNVPEEHSALKWEVDEAACGKYGASHDGFHDNVASQSLRHRAGGGFPAVVAGYYPNLTARWVQVIGTNNPVAWALRNRGQPVPQVGGHDASHDGLQDNAASQLLPHNSGGGIVAAVAGYQKLKACIAVGMFLLRMAGEDYAQLCLQYIYVSKVAHSRSNFIYLSMCVSFMMPIIGFVMAVYEYYGLRAERITNDLTDKRPLSIKWLFPAFGVLILMVIAVAFAVPVVAATTSAAPVVGVAATTSAAPLFRDETLTDRSVYRVGICTFKGCTDVETFDGGRANYYGEGERWIVKSPPVHIQGRFKAWQYTFGLAATRQIAVGGPFLRGNTIVVGCLEEGAITVNGLPVLLGFPSRYRLPNGLGTITYSSKGQLVDFAKARLGRRVVRMDLPMGLTMEVFRWPNYLDFRLSMAPEPNQDGCCGNFNGDATDDSTREVMMRIVGARLLPGENLFDYRMQVNFTGADEKILALCPSETMGHADALCAAFPSDSNSFKACKLDMCFGDNKHLAGRIQELASMDVE